MAGCNSRQGRQWDSSDEPLHGFDRWIMMSRSRRMRILWWLLNVDDRLHGLWTFLTIDMRRIMMSRRMRRSMMRMFWWYDLDTDRYKKDYDEQEDEEEYDENVMMIASMARCLITTLVRQTPRSLLDPGKLERDEKEWIFGKHLFRINFLLIWCNSYE